MSEELKFETTITARNGWFDINFRELWKYRDLILLFVRRNFVALYKQTILGPAWAIIQPLLTTVVFTVVFGNLAGLSAKGVPAFLFFMSGTVAWGYFAGCLTQTANTFIGNSGILGKVYFPRLVMPISTVLTNIIPFLIQGMMFLAFFCYYWCKGAVSPNLYVCLIPLLILHMALLGLGCGVIISALTIKYRDLAMLVSFGIQLWMYGTPVAYDMNIVPAKYMGYYMLNPMTPIINFFRYAFLGLGEVNWTYYGLSVGVTLFIFALGVILFSRVEKSFMDTI